MEMKNIKLKRTSGIELLRIICMALLLGTHEHSFKNWPGSGRFQLILADFLTRYSVPIFIMISALYFDNISKDGWKKIKKIFSYYIVILVIKNAILILHYGDDISIIQNYLTNPLLIVSGMSWYIKGYIITITVMQFISIKLSFRQSLFLGALFILMPMITGGFNTLNINIFNISFNGEILTINGPFTIIEYNGLLIFILITISRPLIIEVKKININHLGTVIITLILIKLSLDYISISLWDEVYDPRAFDTLFNTITPLFIVVAFSKINFYSYKVNKIASLTIIVYLIENDSMISNLIREYGFTELTPFNYVSTIIVKFVLFFIMAYLIKVITDHVNLKLKNKT